MRSEPRANGLRMEVDVVARARQGVSAKRGIEIREGIRDRTPERIESV